MQGKGIGNLSLERKLLIVFTPLPPQGGEGKRKGFVFTPTVPLKGEEEKEGFPQGFVEWRSIFPFGVLSNVTRKTFDYVNR